MAKKIYGLPEEAGRQRVAAPLLPYEPPRPKRYNPGIALIGCGGISQTHLAAYRKSGFRVVALCSRTLAKAEARRDEFFPKAEVFTDYREVLALPEVEVVDLTAHPVERVRLIEDALKARKHVLSQKPFVIDLDVGVKLANLADRMGVRLAVNQNGRWAPHVSYMRQAVARGLIGDVLAVHVVIRWNHDWTAGTAFDQVRHLILYDYGIHWFDMVCAYLGDKTATRVFASCTKASSQRAKPPLLGQALMEYDGAQASLVFDGFARFGPTDQTSIVGTRGTLQSRGPSLSKQQVTLYTAKGMAVPKLIGTWFPDGFRGTMGELLCAIEQSREPANHARGVLKSQALCFEALASADSGKPVVPGKIRRLSAKA